MKRIFFLLVFSFAISSLAQNFVNGDLAGTYTAASGLPTGWLNVPYGDVNCKAAGVNEATPDLTDLNGPDAFNGLSGTPYSGLTFVSGLFETNGGPAYYHEGIMQTVTGLIPNQMYQISFYQSVVKQVNAIDNSGSWAVYIDTTLAGISAPSRDTSNYKKVPLIWQNRTVTFQAKKTSHLIKFLPMDDDLNHNTSTTDTTGGIRMGIDLISLEAGTVGFSTVSRETLLGLYPNPAKDLITISLAKNCAVEILTGEGQILKVIEAEPGQNEIKINELEAGVYFLRTSNSGKMEYQRFLKL